MANDHMSNNSASMDQEFHDKYTVKMIRNGRLTTLIAALLTLVPPLYLWLVVGFKPTWGQIGAGWSIMFSAYFLLYFFEPLGFYPQMGLSGIYIGYLAGNIPSVRLPAMLAAQSATGCEAGTKRGELVGTIAIGMSVFVNLAFTTAAALTGVYILEILPEFVLDAFDFCLPAEESDLCAGDSRDLPGAAAGADPQFPPVPRRDCHQHHPGRFPVFSEEKESCVTQLFYRGWFRALRETSPSALISETAEER
mgnify:FL=1